MIEIKLSLYLSWSAGKLFQNRLTGPSLLWLSREQIDFDSVLEDTHQWKLLLTGVHSLYLGHLIPSESGLSQGWWETFIFRTELQLQCLVSGAAGLLSSQMTYWRELGCTELVRYSIMPVRSMRMSRVSTSYF